MPDEQPLHRSSTTRSTLSDGAAPIHARAYEWYTSLHEQRVAYSIKRIPGTVPVEADGSAFFEVPAMRSLFFVALDERGMSVKRMQSFLTLMPGETTGCVGCHEHRDSAPLPNRLPLAAAREPSKLTPGPPGSRPLRFDELVQPVLQRHCVRCHSPGNREQRAHELDLTPPKSYDSLMSFGDKDLRNLAFERDRSVVGDMPARKSKLLALLTAAGGHEGVRLSAEEFDRLVTWMDTYAHRIGHFSDEQEQQLREFRRELAPMLEESVGWVEVRDPR